MFACAFSKEGKQFLFKSEDHRYDSAKDYIANSEKSLCVYCYTGIEFHFLSSTIIHYLRCQTRVKKPGVMMMALAARKQMR